MKKEKIDKTRRPEGQVLIAAAMPPFLEKGVSWFSQNFSTIIKDRSSNPFLARNTLIAESGQKIKLSEFLRNIADLGYTKVWETQNHGEFSQRGGVVHIFPINSDSVISLEFEGNSILEIASENPSRANENSSLPASKAGRGRAHTYDFHTQDLGFKPGDYVVHLDHGIGIFRGDKNDDFVIEYASPKNRPSEPDLLFVPKTLANKISPYLGFKKPEIHRLGTPIWSLTKRKAKEDIIAFAKELLEIFAKRKSALRAPYSAYPELEEELAATFSYEHTTDQKKSIEEIFADMSRQEPIDRILTGDVGFGKTEVAILTAFRAVLNGRQVALLAPTTILADQHSSVFKSRLEKFGVSVARVTRLESNEQIKEIQKKIAKGSVDIVIGTHKILGQPGWKNLGLLIIDEEQKFGVSHKEKFKKENPLLDILTLSATPIPRTLHFALSGLRAISSIETPPEGRMKIQTFVLPKNNKIIKEAILYELERAGQIYFLANRIHRIPALIEEIKKLKTGAKIGILHGRMSEEKIIGTMHDFRDGKINLLISTTIIENGLDLSNANTLIVEDATKLGLSQAHQLRGRIGRGDREAFAYFFYTAKSLKERAAERLEALERYSWLGAGLELAKRDLEIRGAGNILGRAQSGVAYRIGLNLYFELLEEAITELKSKP